MRSHFLRAGGLMWILLSIGLFVASTASAVEKSAHDLLPPTTVGYLEIPQPGKVIKGLREHPLAEEIEDLPDFQKYLAGKQYQQFRGALELVEDKLGMKWRDAVEPLSSGGLYVGFDLPTQGVVALLQAADESLAQKARDAVIAVARAEAVADNRPDPVKQDELRGVTVHEIANLRLAVLGKWLLASNKPLLVNMVLENYLGSGVSLGSDQQFQSVRKGRTGEPEAWLYLDLRVLRLTGVLRTAANKKSNNPPAEVIAGGIVGVLPEASYVTASLDLDPSQVKVTATMPGKPQAAARKREFFFGPDGKGVAPPLLQPRNTLLTVSAYRDFASLWRNAPDLFDDRINAKFAEAESGLATFFGGRNFRDEILGNLQPGVQVVVARQEFPQGGVTPAIKLPAAAVVARMKNPEETARTFKITFQSVIGFLNIIGGMKGLPPLDLNSERIDGGLMISTEYLPPKAETRQEAAIHHNASPTAVFIGERFILSSTRSLALELAQDLKGQLPADDGINSAVIVDPREIHTALAENVGALIARNMLDRGHDRAAAEKEIQGLLSALHKMMLTSIELGADHEKLQLTVLVLLAQE